MRLNHVMLACADVARSLTFYQGLGLTPIVLDHLPDGTLRYARLTFPDGDATLSLERADPPDDVVAGGVIVYLECDDLDPRVEALSRAGHAFAAGPETKPWLWREALLLDPDGHRVCLYHAGSYRLDPPWRLPPSPAERRAEATPPAADPSGPIVPDAFLATRNRGYVDAAIPSGRDDDVAAFLERVAAGDDAGRERVADALGPGYTATFLSYAERMASLAARTRDAGRARLGVLAVAFTWRACADVRPAIPVLGVLHDAVARAGGDPARVFRDAAAQVTADVAPVIDAFLTRDDLDDIATEMGFSAGSDRDGFRYRRMWGAGRIDDDV